MNQQGAWTRASIQRDQERVRKADARREERLAHHSKYGERMCDGSLYPFEMCMCWGCRADVRDVGTEREGQE